MFGPVGKSDKPTPKPEAEVFDIGTKKKVDDRRHYDFKIRDLVYLKVLSQEV